MQYFQDHYTQLQHLQMLIYVKALPALLFGTRRGGYLYWHRSRTLQRGYVWFGEDRADCQTHTKSTITPPSGEAANYWLCKYVCVCLMSDWLGRGVGVVRTLEATPRRTTSDPTHLHRCTLAPSVRSDGDSCLVLKRYNRAAVGLCQTGLFSAVKIHSQSKSGIKKTNIEKSICLSASILCF